MERQAIHSTFVPSAVENGVPSARQHRERVSTKAFERQPVGDTEPDDDCLYRPSNHTAEICEEAVPHTIRIFGSMMPHVSYEGAPKFVQPSQPKTAMTRLGKDGTLPVVGVPNMPRQGCATNDAPIRSCRIRASGGGTCLTGKSDQDFEQVGHAAGYHLNPDESVPPPLLSDAYTQFVQMTSGMMSHELLRSVQKMYSNANGSQCLNPDLSVNESAEMRLGPPMRCRVASSFSQGSFSDSESHVIAM